MKFPVFFDAGRLQRVSFNCPNNSGATDVE